MIAFSLPNYPSHIIGIDLFQHKITNYLLVNYFSINPEIAKVTDTASKSVIATLRLMFARRDIPEVFLSDNSPQYDSQKMIEFTN